MIKLLKIQLLDCFDINKLLYCKDRKEKNRLMFMAGTLIFVFCMLTILAFIYTYSMAKGYEALGVLDLFMPLLMLTASLVTLITTLYKASGLLFRFRDYEMLMALPIKTSRLIGSRILMLYVMSLFFNLILLLPSCIAYGLIAQPSIDFYILFGMSLPFIPLVPIIIATFIGAMISFIASRFKSVQSINLILTFGFLIGFMLLSTQANTLEGEWVNLSQMLVATMNKLYPLAPLYGEAIGGQNLGAFFLFIVISVLAFTVFTGLLSLCYKKLNTQLASGSTQKTYIKQDLYATSPFMALYKKEMKRYFSSSLYVLNTGFGMVIMAIASVVIAFKGASGLESMLQMSGMSSLFKVWAPFVLAACCTLSCTTACSISLEGNNWWIIKSSPIKAHSLFMSKVALNLTVIIPILLISSSLVAYGLKTSFSQTLLLYILPLAYSFFTTFVGLLVNLKFPNFNWSSETIVIKQSLATLLSLLVGFISLGIPMMVIYLFPNLSLTLLAIYTTLCLFLLDILLYAYIKQKGDTLLTKL